MSLNTLLTGRRMKMALPIVFTFVGLASIAWQASLDLDLAQNKSETTRSSTVTKTAPAPANKTAVLTGLFGDAKTQTIKRPESLPQTRLQLSIRGLFANADGSGQALIAANNKPAKLYRVGEELPGNAVLESIHAEHLVLKRAGRFEQLRLLPQQAGSGNQKTAASNTNTSRKQRTATASSSQPTSNNSSLTERLKRLRAQK